MDPIEAEDSIVNPKTPSPSRPLILTRWLFLRALGCIYLIAFLSLLPQFAGLYGDNGLLPISQTMQAVHRQPDANFFEFPTLLWIDGSESFAYGLVVGGVILSVLAIVGIAPVVTFALVWLFYLSLVTVGLDFLSFQWDILLLETGFLAIFLAPWTLLPRLDRETPPSWIAIFLLRVLLFRLMFGSGVIKLASRDESWLTMSALPLHYETQPLPTPLAWYMYHLMPAFHTASVFIMFIIELVVPFFFFMPRRIRFIGALATVFLQIMILTTGNYTFFNWLTIILCIPLLDDDLLRRLFTPRMQDAAHEAAQRPAPRWRRMIMIPLAVVILSLGAIWTATYFMSIRSMPQPALQVLQAARPFALVNRYGLFSVMTTSRPEIIIEGSNDGENWLAYEFPYKAGDVNRPLPIIAPYQPRLDWQMWFAALGSSGAWFGRLMQHIKQGTPEVLSLLAYNPFPDAPPQFLRAQLYDYHYTTPQERAETGAWWKRTLLGDFYR